MIDAKFKKIGTRNFSNIKINIPEAYKKLFTDINVEIIEIDNNHCIYFTDKNNEDLVSVTIKDFQYNENMKNGFKKAISCLEEMLKDTNNTEPNMGDINANTFGYTS